MKIRPMDGNPTPMGHQELSPCKPIGSWRAHQERMALLADHLTCPKDWRILHLIRQDLPFACWTPHMRGEGTYAHAFCGGKREIERESDREGEGERDSEREK